MSKMLEISIFGREYHVGCQPEEEKNLHEAAEMVDSKLREFSSRTGASGEKLVVMTALNLAHELLRMQRGDGFDLPEMKRKMNAMNTRLDSVLAQQEKLF